MTGFGQSNLPGPAMKVVHRSDTLLVLEDQPWFFGVFLIAMTLVFIGGGLALIGQGLVLGGALLGVIGGGISALIAALTVRRVRLSLDQKTGHLTRTSRSVHGLSHEVHALDRLVEARVGVSIDSDGNTYRTELHLQDPPETVPFTSYYTNGRKPDQMAQAVNDWLTGHHATFTPVNEAGNR